MLVQLSDLHLRAGTEGAGAAARLERAVRAVAELRPRPLAVLLSGDLADEASPEAYELAHQLLSPLGLPLHAIPGNHDDRDLLRDRFGPDDAPPGTPVRFAVECGPLRLVGCDSTIPGAIEGALGGEQFDWLDWVLAEAPEHPTLLALHHPPVLTGIEAMDLIALGAADSARLEALLERHRQVLAVTCGHVHSGMITAFAGRPLLVCPSTNSAVRLDLRAREAIPFATTGRPVGFVAHALLDGRLVSHLQPVEQPPLPSARSGSRS